MQIRHNRGWHSAESSIPARSTRCHPRPLRSLPNVPFSIPPTFGAVRTLSLSTPLPPSPLPAFIVSHAHDVKGTRRQETLSVRTDIERTTYSQGLETILPSSHFTFTSFPPLQLNLQSLHIPPTRDPFYPLCSSHASLCWCCSRFFSITSLCVRQREQPHRRYYPSYFPSTSHLAIRLLYATICLYRCALFINIAR